MTRRDTYTRFCDTAPPDLPLFMQPWYLDAVCADGQWDAALVEKGGQIVAVWPYFLKQKWGWRYIAMPPLARMMGPYLLPEWRTTRKEASLLEELLDRLPTGLAAFEQDFNYTAQNWLPLHWRGFRQTTRYSYRLEVSGLDEVWKNLAPDYRNQKIPKALEAVEVGVASPSLPSSRGAFRPQTAFKKSSALDDFLEIHDQSYERKGLDPPVSYELMSRLDEALVGQGRRAIFFANDRNTGAIHSVAYLAWDNQSAWYLMAGDNPALRQSGAGILLTWEAIRFTREVLQLPVFDFAGSMIRTIERVRRQFGAEQKPYFRVQKEWSLVWKMGKMLRQ